MFNTMMVSTSFDISLHLFESLSNRSARVILLELAKKVLPSTFTSEAQCKLRLRLS